jgi:hypothetical protein
MKNFIIVLSAFVLFAFSLFVFNCSKDDTPVGTSQEQTVNKLKANATLVPIGHTQSAGTLFVSYLDRTPVSGLGNSNITVRMDWNNSDSPNDSSVNGVVTLTPNILSGKSIAGAFTMDYTTTMDSLNIHTMEDGIINYIDSMKSTDISEIVKYDSIVQEIQPFTNDKNLLRNAVRSTWHNSPSVYTSLYLSTFRAVTQVSNNQYSNLIRSAIAFTDGSESALTLQKSVLTNYAIVTGTPVFAIGLFYDTVYYDNGFWRDLRNVTDTTGGFCYWVHPDSCRNLTAVYSNIKWQLSNSYDLKIDWTGTLPQPQTLVRITITINYENYTASILRTYRLN